MIKILIADDDQEDVDMALEAMNHCRVCNPIDRVSDGQELMDYLNNTGPFTDKVQYSKPGLILLDLNMPKLDGREALQQIKNNPDLRHIPVVVLTTSKAELDIIKTYDLGVNSFITKPVTFDGLVEVVRTLGKYWFEVVALPPI
jgi:CheY-like chemotaxis protein